jgi:hypothetical protein
MNVQLTNIPTDSLIDMLFLILRVELTVTAHDATELDQIQRELQRRGEDRAMTGTSEKDHLGIVLPYDLQSVIVAAQNRIAESPNYVNRVASGS